MKLARSTWILLACAALSGLATAGATIAVFDPSSLDEQASRAARRGQFARAAELQARHLSRQQRPRSEMVYQLGLYQKQAGQLAESVQSFREAVRLMERRLRRIESSGRASSTDWYNLACFRALAGDRENALTALETAVERGWWRRADAERDPDLERLRDEPRYLAALEKMTQAQQERQTELARPPQP